MSMYSLYVYLHINYEYITHVTFATVTLQERLKCYMREEIANKVIILLATSSLKIHFKLCKCSKLFKNKYMLCNLLTKYGNLAA